jgi:SAM-dependent methyltransferase
MPPGKLRYVHLWDIGFDTPDGVHEHLPSPPGVLRRILPRSEVTGDDVFIDIGCGMGTAVVEAAGRYDFRRVIGIDVVPQFTAVARETIARGQRRLRCDDVQVVTGDVREYELPDDVTVVYMFDPVRAQLFDLVIAKLIDSVDRHPRQLRIIYNYPAEAGRLERTGRVRLVRYGRRRTRPWMTAPDLAMYEIEPRSGTRVVDMTPRPPRTRPWRRLRWEGPRTSDGTSRPDDNPEAIVQLASTSGASGSSVVSVASAQDLHSLRARFEREHCVRLPGFLSGPLLSRVQRYIDEGEFSAPAYERFRNERFMEHGKAVELLLLLLNDPGLFELVQAITGCERIGRFDGRVYRVLAAGDDEAWHGEIFGYAPLEMSLDLSARPYSGGVLETRDRYSQETVGRQADIRPGDAVLVRLAPSVQHRVTAVEGASRTAYAGRFTVFKRGADSKLARPGARS